MMGNFLGRPGGKRSRKVFYLLIDVKLFGVVVAIFFPLIIRELFDLLPSQHPDWVTPGTSGC